MAAALREALPGAAGDHVFYHVGDVALHAEAALAPPDAEPAPAATEFVAASSRFALAFFGDALGACPAAHARHAARACCPVLRPRSRAPGAPLSYVAGVCGLTLDQLLSHAAENNDVGSKCVARGPSRADARRRAPPRPAALTH